MSRKKKILGSLLVVLVLAGLGAYLVGNYLLDTYSRQFMSSLAKRGRQHGVIATDPQFVHAKITGLKSAQWTSLLAELQFPNSQAFDPEKVFELRVDQIDAWLAGSGNVTVQASGFSLDTKPAVQEGKSAGPSQTLKETVTAKKIQCTFPMELSDPMSGLEDFLSESVELMRTGSSSLPLSAKAVLEFTLKNEPVKVGMRVEERAGAFALVLEGADLHAISSLFQEALTDAEVTVLAEYPMRAAQLLRIKDDAETTSLQAHNADETVPQDAYRHVLWSYLLTKKYSADFAKRVTDAHEEGDTGNTEAEREMDYNNNEVGRRLARTDIRRADILDHVRSASEVVRKAN